VKRRSVNFVQGYPLPRDIVISANKKNSLYSRVESDISLSSADFVGIIRTGEKFCVSSSFPFFFFCFFYQRNRKQNLRRNFSAGIPGHIPGHRDRIFAKRLPRKEGKQHGRSLLCNISRYMRNNLRKKILQ